MIGTGGGSMKGKPGIPRYAVWKQKAPPQKAIEVVFVEQTVKRTIMEEAANTEA